MKTASLSLTVLLSLAAACAHPGAGVTPAQREKALRLFVEGESTDEIATQLAISQDDARAAVRVSLRSLMLRYRHGR
jgi:DNA-binding NarL/FixJ family response regulator